jgi:hypothetical protein
MKLYKIFIPKCYNDGRKIETKKIREVLENIRKRFGSYSLNPLATLPLIQGVWTSDSTNKIYREQVFMVELFVQDTFDNQKWLKSFREIIRQELHQEEIFIIVQDAEIIYEK